MSSKRHSDVQGVGRKAKRQRQRRHLYFVVDDGDGYAIRKMDLWSDYDSDDDAARHEDGEIETVGAAWSPLPEALIRLPAQTGEFFVASGTKILITDCGWPEHAVPVFDVHSRSLTLGPRPHSRTCPHSPIYMPALFDPALEAWVGLSGDKDTLGHLCSSDVPPVEPDDADSDDDDDEGGPYQEDDDDDDESDPYKEEVNEENLPRRHLLQLITFTLKYDKNGELTTAKRRRVRCFELLRHADPLFDDIRAFWI
ncbi:hypothetical protein CFC21_073809 [Triticum aestivum]|uniref:DUF1618 domain-containing protein n=2 Tax=Triticum aestivum TaxID=4565 RepID=A0A9R1HMB9_WHEAT|nr:hypothetical protein CFC21_073809 [Triticum aestivum]